MATFDVPSREELHAEFISAYAVAQPEKNVSRGSDPFRLSRVVTGVLWSALARLLFFVKQALPDKAEKEHLERWGKVFSFARRPPTGATGALALRVSGTPGSPIAAGEQLAHNDGTLYQVTTVGAIVGGGGTVDVDIAAISTGSATNKVTGEQLTFVNALAGVTPQAVLVKDLKNGEDNESDDDYRIRMLAHIGDPPTGGAVHDWLEWVLSKAGKSAYVWRHRRGLGTVDVAVLGDGTGSQRIITDLAPITDFLNTVRPANMKDFKVLTTTELQQPTTVRISIDETRYRWDWNDDGLSSYIITASNQVTSTITVPGAPATITAGKRLTVRGEEARVTQRVGDVLTLAFTAPATWFSFAVSNGVDFIRASGDLVVPVRNAIIAVYNRLGPARDSRYAATSWEADLLVDSIVTASRNVKGCTKVIVDTPVGDINAADLLGNDIVFITPGNVQVWRRV